MASSSLLRMEKVATRHSGQLKCYIQGDIYKRNGKVVFLTVHDVGQNHRSFLPFTTYSAMKEVMAKTVWIHVCLPGQDNNDMLLPDQYNFPNLDQFAHDLIFVLEAFGLKTVMGFGEGAGGNILCRFGLYYPNRCLGMVILDPTASTAGVEEHLKNTVSLLDLKKTVFNLTENSSKVVDKLMGFTNQHKKGRNENWKQNKINPQNLSQYLDVWLKRTDITPLLHTLKAEGLLVVGGYSPFLSPAKAMLKPMDKSHTTLLVFDDVGDPLGILPWNMARALILFAKGCGILMGVPLIGLEDAYHQVNNKDATSTIAKQSIAKMMVANEKELDNKENVAVKEEQGNQQKKKASSEYVCRSSTVVDGGTGMKSDIKYVQMTVIKESYDHGGCDDDDDDNDDCDDGGCDD